MNVRSLLAASLFAAVLTSAGVARADDPPPFAARAEGSRVGLSVDLWPTQDFFITTMALSAQFSVHRNVGIDIEVPWAVGHEGGSDLGTSGNTYAYFGNVSLGAHGVFRVLPEASLNIGASIWIPTRFSFQNAPDLAVFAAAAALSRGYYDLNRLFPEALSIRIPIGFEARFLNLLYYRGELNPVILIPVGSDVSGGSAQAILEHADEIELRAPFGLGGGLRFQVAFLLTNGIADGDHAQTALEPFVGYEPSGTGFYARLGMLVALDSTLGPGTDRDKLTTARLQFGGKF